jgi:hypothetical protein
MLVGVFYVSHNTQMLGIYAYLMIQKKLTIFWNFFKLKNDYEEKIDKKSFRTRQKIKRISE